MSETFLYLTTTGHKSGHSHRIEIWYVAHESRYYCVSEKRERAHWVQNIIADPSVTFSVGTRDQPESVLPLSAGRAALIRPAEQPELAEAVSRLMDTKYNWSAGLIVQLSVAE